MHLLTLGIERARAVRPYSSEIQNVPSLRRIRLSQSMESLSVPSCACPAGKTGKPSAAGIEKSASNLLLVTVN